MMTDKKHSEKTIKKAVALHNGGTSLIHICSQFNISSDTLKNWVNQYPNEPALAVEISQLKEKGKDLRVKITQAKLHALVLQEQIDKKW